MKHCSNNRIATRFGACLPLVLAALLIGQAVTAEEQPDMVLNIGTTNTAAQLGFGWGEPLSAGPSTYCWINRMEADIGFDAPGPEPARIIIHAAPLNVAYRQQRVGLYLNGQFIEQWDCPKQDVWTFHPWRVDVPAGMLHQGPNTLTLRVSYRGSSNHKNRALAVEMIDFFWNSEPLNAKP